MVLSDFRFRGEKRTSDQTAATSALTQLRQRRTHFAVMRCAVLSHDVLRCGPRPAGRKPIRRREFITLLGGATVAWPLAARAQQPSVPVIEFMSARSPDNSVSLLQAFHIGLREESGFADGENVKVEYRWARGNYGLLPALASEFVERRVNVLVAVGGDASARAARAATSAIPIVFAMGGDPVEAGLVESITGQRQRNRMHRLRHRRA